MFHSKVSPNKVSGMPGQPKLASPRPANAAGRNCSIRYLNTVIRLLTITNRPPSRTHLAAAGCLAAKLFQKFIYLYPPQFYQTSLVCSVLLLCLAAGKESLDQTAQALEEVAVHHGHHAAGHIHGHRAAGHLGNAAEGHVVDEQDVQV